MVKPGFKLLFAILGLTSTGVSMAQSTADPVANLVRAGGVNKEDEVVVASFDWNEDGKDDLLVTTGADIETAGRIGASWSVWLSNASGTYDSAGDVTAPDGGFSFARLSETGSGKALVVYEPNGGGTAGINAFYLNSGGKVETKRIGTIDTSGVTGIEESAALEKRVFGSAEKVEPKRIPAAQLWPKEGPASAPPPAVPQASQLDTIEVVDPLDQNRWLILRASANSRSFSCEP